MSKGLFSVVVALYGVENYVDVFFKSLERQTFPIEDLDIIVVDDESQDASYEKVKEWAEKYPHAIRHTTKSNGGPASARNVGLEMAKNEWVTFCDPDDALQSKYFEEVAGFIARDVNRRAAMLTTRVMIWQEQTERVSDTHPLARKYFFGDRLVDLNEDPNFIQLGGASIFVRREVVNGHSLRFDTRIRPTFEDGEFIGRYLSKFNRPIVGLVSGARYFYRKRGDGSSLVQTGWSQAERYDNVLRYGYLGMLRTLAKEHGKVPRWAQNMVLYDLQWYLTEDKKMHSTTAWVNGSPLANFHNLLKEVFAYLDREAIDNFNVTAFSWITREAMLTRFKGQGFRVNRVFHWSERGDGPIQVVYTYAGVQPQERFEVDGVTVLPTRTKSTNHVYFGETFFIERSVWLPAGGRAAVWINDEFIPFASPKRPGWTRPKSPADLSLAAPTKPSAGIERVLQNLKVPDKARTLLAPVISVERLGRKLENRVAIEQIVSNSGVLEAGSNVARRVLGRKMATLRLDSQKKADLATLAWATSEANSRRFQEAWVIMDRVDQADDNGEHLYRYLRKAHPEINAWFLLDRKSRDWDRLEAEGFRLVEYGSKESVALALASKYQISSDATHGVQYPIDQKRYGRQNTKFIFLQHGVIKDDLSRWLNPKDISMIVTSSEAEYQSIAGDNTPYRFTAKETKLTGLPRYDGLARKAAALRPEERNYLLVMPTWRQDLKFELQKLTSKSERIRAFSTSEYGRQWLAFLWSPELRKTAEQSDVKVVYVPHPSMSSFVDGLQLPPFVQIIDQSQVSLQDVLVRTKCVVTDYSSIFFDVAFLGASVVYFQFDSGEIYNGSHNYRRGYFDYETHGLGPVSFDLPTLLATLEEAAKGDFARPAVYNERARDTFKYFDANNCQRVFEAICELG